MTRGTNDLLDLSFVTCHHMNRGLPKKLKKRCASLAEVDKWLKNKLMYVGQYQKVVDFEDYE